MVRLTTYLDLESLEIQRSSFDFKSNLTSAIGDLANHNILASYVSRLNAMAYDIRRVIKLVFYYPGHDAIGILVCL